MTPGPMDPSADNATAPAAERTRGPNPNPVPVTEEGRSWAAVTALVMSARNGERKHTHSREVALEILKAVADAERSELGAVEAELGRLREIAAEVYELVGPLCDCDDLYGPCVSCTIKPALASSPGREGRDGGTDETADGNEGG